MHSELDTVMLLCAVLAALAAGVILGYFTCMGVFSLFNLHARSVMAARAATQPEVQALSA